MLGPPPVIAPSSTIARRISRLVGVHFLEFVGDRSVGAAAVHPAVAPWGRLWIVGGTSTGRCMVNLGCKETTLLVEKLRRATMLEVFSVQGHGAAAGGRRTHWTGAQPCSYTYAPMLPARAAVGAAGSGVLWPRQWVRRPLPRVPSVMWRMILDAAARSTALSGRCRCHHSTDASTQEAVGRAGFERFGLRWLRASFITSVSFGSGMRTRAETPLAPLSGCRGLDRTTDATILVAVGRGGVGLLGVWRGLEVAAFLAAAFVAAHLIVVAVTLDPVR